MYKTILVPLDGSALASAALPHACNLAKATGALIMLLRVTPAPAATRDGGSASMTLLEYANAERFHAHDLAPVRAHEYPAMGHEQPPWIEREMEEANRYLTEVAAELTRSGIAAETLVRPDDIAGTILDVADEVEADMIVMSSHGRGGIRRFLLSSVTDRVLHHAKVPMLVVRPIHNTDTITDTKTDVGKPATEMMTAYRRILVPLDGSELAARVLPHVQQLASCSGAEVTLFRAYLEPGESVEVIGYGEMAEPEITRESAGHYLQVMADNLRKHDIQVHTLIERGQPADCILDAAETTQANLIAMSTHGRSGIGRFLMGSVADRVARHARAPVLLVR